MVKGFPEDVRQEIGDAQHWVCKHCINRLDDFHHMLPNTEPHRRAFPLFLNSPFNCVGLCKTCHEKYPHLYRVTYNLAEVYENWLTRKLNA